MVSKLHGRELSFNNLLDLDSGRRLIEDFELPAAAIIKHNNPCGVAVGAGAGDAFERALASDPQSAFGGVMCFNRRVDRALAERLHSLFVEMVFAPGYDDDALELLEQKPNVRLLENQERRRMPIAEHDVKRVRGGLLVQDRDTGLEERGDMQVVSERKPTEPEWGELLFAIRVAKHVRSNAIVLARELGSVGIGAGQMSRVDSVRIAIEKGSAGDRDLGGAVMASDAFFPFPDGPQLAIDAGVRAIIQPGGSQRDHEVIDACDAARRGDGLHRPAPLPPLSVSTSIEPSLDSGRQACFMREPHHPSRGELELPSVLHALSDPARLGDRPPARGRRRALLRDLRPRPLESHPVAPLQGPARNGRGAHPPRGPKASALPAHRRPRTHRFPGLLDAVLAAKRGARKPAGRRPRPDGVRSGHGVFRAPGTQPPYFAPGSLAQLVEQRTLKGAPVGKPLVGRRLLLEPP